MKPKTVIKCDCGDTVECPPAKDKNGAPTNRNVIAAFFHCKQCMAELPIGESPRDWAQIEAGFTEIGIQIWCKRHEANIAHIDFEGHTHPATLSARKGNSNGSH